MTPRLHTAELIDWLATAAEKRRRGKRMQESECLWCAAKHAVDAVALLNNRNPNRARRIRYDRTGNKAAAVNYIAALNPDYPGLVDGFDAARRKLHPYSEHRQLDDLQLDYFQSEVRQFINDMLAIAGRMPE